MLALLLIPLLGVPDCLELGPVGELLHDVEAAWQVVENEPPPPKKRTWLQRLTGRNAPKHTDLERDVIEALSTTPTGFVPCESIRRRLLSATVDSPPGFAAGREQSYRTALELMRDYGYVFEDERDFACEPVPGGAQWSAQELASAQVLIGGLGPWAQDLAPLGFVRQTRQQEPFADLSGDAFFIPYADGTVEIRMFDATLEYGRACQLVAFTHELVHAFFHRQPELGLMIARELGWQTETEYRTKLYGEGDWKLTAWQWTMGWLDAGEPVRPPFEYGDVQNPPHHQTGFKEDLADRGAVYALGPALQGLVAINESATDEADLETPEAARIRAATQLLCSSVVFDRMPQPDDEVAALFDGVMNAPMGLLRPPEIAKTKIGVATIADLAAQSEVRFEMRGTREYWFWKPEGADGTEWIAVLNESTVVGVGSDLKDQNVTRESLVAEHGEPTRETDGRLVWSDKLMVVDLDEAGRPATVIYGYVRSDP